MNHPPQHDRFAAAKALVESAENKSTGSSMALEPNAHDLQRLLEDERQRNAQHRNNFQKLKEEHVRLQNDYVNLQKELKKALQTVQDARTNQAALLQKADKIICEKDNTLMKLQTKLDSIDEDKIRREAEEKVRTVFSKHTQELRKELETHRAALHEGNLRIAALKAQVENCQRAHQRAEEELKLKHRTELKQLQGELDKLRSKDDLEDTRERIGQVIRLQREQAQLQLKLKNAEADLRDLQNERDSLLSEARAAAQTHAELLATAEESKRSIEFKLKSLQSQKEVAEEAASKCRHEMSNTARRMVNLEEEKLRLKGQLAEAERRHKAEVSELRLAAARQKAEVESGHEQMVLELTKARLDAELALKVAAERKRAAAEKERDFEDRLQTSRAKDLETVSKLESGKFLLEAQIAEERAAKEQAERRLADAEATLKKEKESHERKRLEWQEEMSELRGKLKSKMSAIEDVEKVVGEKHAMRQHLLLLEEERQKDRIIIKELVQQKEALEGAMQTLRTELQDAQISAIKASEANEKATVQLKLTWEQEKYNFVKRIEDLESDLRQTHKEHDWKLASMIEKYKKEKKMVDAYKAKLKVLKSAHQEIEREAARLRQNIPHDIHEKVKEELSNLRRRQLEFHRVIEAAPVVDEAGSVPSATKLRASKDDRAMLVLKEKVDHIDKQQQKQMSHLTTLVERLAAARTIQSSISSSVSSISGKESSIKSSSSSATSSSKSK